MSLRLLSFGLCWSLTLSHWLAIGEVRVKIGYSIASCSYCFDVGFTKFYSTAIAWFEIKSLLAGDMSKDTKLRFELTVIL